MSTTATETTASTSVTLKNDRTVRAAFNYWGKTSPPEVAELHPIFSGTSPNLKTVTCTVADIRTYGLSTFNLSDHAFQILQHSSSLLSPVSQSIPDFHDDLTMKSTYWPEIISLVKSQLGVRSAAAINTTVRDVSEVNNISSSNPRANPKQKFYPFTFVHGDYTPAGGRGHMRAMLPTFFEDNGNVKGTTAEEQDQFLRLKDEILAAEQEAMKEEGVSDPWQWSGKNYSGPRWGMLSVWRPLQTVHRDPLAVMDPRSLFEGVEKPYVALKRPYKDRPGFEKEYFSENLLPIAPEGKEHKWYWISEQTPEELYALKLFDSEAHKQGSRVAPCAAHSAFRLPGQEDQEARKSAEIRVMVIW
ncbi:GA4 desaturase [Exophiala viscosa]|uniref:GA4 desaturase n=1 Tax=Exophiala viscosa TaxID=2486360 RepID=UPI0021910142|nr:GA4 desaturase [Exophiala viscosa]